MKKLIALILAGILMLSCACLAAQWPEGCSPSRPNAKQQEVDLSTSMGYIVLSPRGKLTVTRFCDVLMMYLPREDLVRGAGLLHLYEKVPGQAEDVEVCSVDFSNHDSVEFRKISETELNMLKWGGGTAIDIHLPKSLEFGDRYHDYYVLMDEGCFTANGGRVKSIGIFKTDAWQPSLSGQYGVSGLRYIDAPYVERPMGTPEPDPIANPGINGRYAPEDPTQGAAAAASDYQPEVVGMDGQSIDSAPAIPDYQPEVVGMDGQSIDTAPVIPDYQPEVVGMDGGVIESASGMFGDSLSDDGFLGADDAADAGSEGGYLGAADAGSASAGTGYASDEDIPLVPLTLEQSAPADNGVYAVHPDAGDYVFFDVVLGGDARIAIPFSENGSVEFDVWEYNRSTHVIGRVVSNDVNWGVAFLNDEEDTIDMFRFGRVYLNR